MARGVWGLDVSKSSLKAVRLEFNKGRVELTDVDVISYTLSPAQDEVTLEQEIRRALLTFVGRHRLKGDSIAASLPSHSTFNRFIKLTPTSPERLKDILQFEAQQHIPFPINEVIWTYQTIDRVYQPGEETDIVIFAIKRELVDQFLTLMAVSGIRVDVVQFAPVALYNYVMLDAPVEGKNFVILDIGANNTDLILVHGEKFWIRNLPIVGSDITKAVQQKFDIPFPEAEKLKLSIKEAQQAGKIFTAIQPVLKDLVNEIHRSIGYYKSLAAGRTLNFSKIITLGNASKTIYFDEFVSQRLSLEVVRLTKLNKIDIRPGVGQELLQTQLTSLGVAMGLGLQGLNLTANRINLLPPELVKIEKAAKRRPFVAATAAIIGLILVLLYFSAQSTYKALDQVYAEAQDQNEDWSKIKKEQKDALKGLDTLENKLKRDSKIVPDRNIWNKIFNAFEAIPALQKHTLDSPKPYIEVGNANDQIRLKNFERGKIWILHLMVQETRDKKTPMLSGSPATCRLSLVCGIVYREKEDGSPDPVASLNFVKDHLVEPLAKKLNITAPPDPVQSGGSEPVSSLSFRSDEEGVADEGEPKYFLFKVTLEIPLG